MSETTTPTFTGEEDSDSRTNAVLPEVTKPAEPAECPESCETQTLTPADLPAVPSEDESEKTPQDDKETVKQSSSESEDDDDLFNSESLSLLKNTESGMNRFFEQSYTNPEVARSASKSLIDAFDDKGLWLANLVHPDHLVQELRQQCASLTTLVVTQWVRQGETHKLKMLGESLLRQTTPLTQEGGRITALLAGLLGILRPQIAQNLLETSRPHLVDENDLSLLRDAQQWVEVGRLLDKTPPDERVFWNRRLREPKSDWNWETAEARLALQRLSQSLPKESANLQIIQNAVPGCWWDLWRAQSDQEQATASSALLQQTKTKPQSRRGSFTLGLLLGVAAVLAAGWIYLVASGVTVQRLLGTSLQSAMLSSASETSEDVDDGTPAPPIRESLRQLKSVLSKTTLAGVKPSLAASSTRAVASSASADTASSDGSTMVRGARQPHPKEISREKERLAFSQKYPDARRLHSLARDGTWRENANLVQGRTGAAPQGSMVHRNLLRLLILDPPEQADVRIAATKLAVRSLQPSELISLFDLCLYPDSPNEIEVKQCAELLLELPDENMSVEQRRHLQQLLAGQ